MVPTCPIWCPCLVDFSCVDLWVDSVAQSVGYHRHRGCGPGPWGCGRGCGHRAVEGSGCEDGAGDLHRSWWWPWDHRYLYPHHQQDQHQLESHPQIPVQLSEQHRRGLQPPGYQNARSRNLHLEALDFQLPFGILWDPVDWFLVFLDDVN